MPQTAFGSLWRSHLEHRRLSYLYDIANFLTFTFSFWPSVQGTWWHHLKEIGRRLLWEMKCWPKIFREKKQAERGESFLSHQRRGRAEDLEGKGRGLLHFVSHIFRVQVVVLLLARSNTTLIFFPGEAEKNSFFCREVFLFPTLKNELRLGSPAERGNQVIRFCSCFPRKPAHENRRSRVSKFGELGDVQSVGFLNLFVWTWQHLIAIKKVHFRQQT